MVLNNDIRGHGMTPGDSETSSRDEPLQQITHDNIFNDVFIGPESAFTFSDGETHVNSVFDPTTGEEAAGQARRYKILNLEIELTNNNLSNIAFGVLVGDGHNIPPNTGTRFVRQEDEEEGGADGPEVITIDVDNELMEMRPDADGEITRMFTGVVTNASRVESHAFEFVAFWPGFNELQNGTIEVSTAFPIINDITPIPENAANAIEDTNQRVKASYLAKEIGQRVTDDSIFGYDINITEDGTNINGTPAGRDKQISTTTDQISTEDAQGLVNRITEATNSVWEVDRHGQFSIGPPVPDGDIPTGARVHKLRYLTDADAGRTSPMWRSVKVVGDGVVSQDGWESSSMAAEEPVVLKENVVDNEEELSDPTFVYRNFEIDTVEEAKDVLEKLTDKLREQLASGEVEVVGHPEVWPGDSIEMPDSRDQPFASERFLITKIVHRLNNSDGFLTKIEVGGQTNASRAFFEGDEEVELQKEYQEQKAFDRQLYRAAESEESIVPGQPVDDEVGGEQGGGPGGL